MARLVSVGLGVRFNTKGRYLLVLATLDGAPGQVRVRVRVCWQARLVSLLLARGGRLKHVMLAGDH
eukprot:scaffold44964_cov62-Phaeocystis_antarctica.AAC.1